MARGYRHGLWLMAEHVGKPVIGVFEGFSHSAISHQPSAISH
jgi:hypothetical protein